MTGAGGETRNISEAGGSISWVADIGIVAPGNDSAVGAAGQAVISSRSYDLGPDKTFGHNELTRIVPPADDLAIRPNCHTVHAASGDGHHIAEGGGNVGEPA